MNKNLIQKTVPFVMGLGLSAIASFLTIMLFLVIMDSYKSTVPHLIVILPHVFIISGVITSCFVTVMYAAKNSKKYGFQFKPLNSAIISICIFVVISTKLIMFMISRLGRPELFLVDFAVILLLLVFVKLWENKNYGL